MRGFFISFYIYSIAAPIAYPLLALHYSRIDPVAQRMGIPLAYMCSNDYTMNQYEVSAEIADEIPEIKKEIVREPVFGSVYMSIKVLTSYTVKMLQTHQLRQVERCMKLADKIYNKGNKLVKTAIENVFIFSFSNLQGVCTRREWQEIQTKMPVTLFSLYIQQIMKPGI